jgi:hypothetical protein
MTEKDDDKPVISLAAKREAEQRDFAQERADMIEELLELGQSASAQSRSTSSYRRKKSTNCI